MQFGEMFWKATGYHPYPYQTRLAESQGLPRMVDIPTGAGKTGAVVLAWLWRRRFASDAVKVNTPRRLVYCLPMRSLVEQTRDNVVKWLDRLELLDGPVSYDAADGAHVVSYTPSWNRHDGIAVTVLMGGEDADRWDEHPERDAIIIGTQDMLLSRALNRGYAMSRFRWPVHFALLNNDVLWVIDETQLMGVGVETSAQLQAFRDSFGTHGDSASIWMSATLGRCPLDTVDSHRPEGGWPQLCLSEEDLKDSGLKARYSSHKDLRMAGFRLTDESGDGPYLQELADLVMSAHRPGSLSLVVLNNVKRAQGVYKHLLEKGRSEGNTGLLHSRFREPDRSRGMSILSSDGDRVIVSTQVVEAGVDASSKTLITELAPWSSMVQRFGRCNRYGEFSDATVYWVDVEVGGESGLEAPYDATDLNSARSLLVELKDVGPDKLLIAHDEVPCVRPVLRRKDLFDFFDTTPDLLGNDLDVSVFVRDGEDKDVQVYWRVLESGVPTPGMPSPHRSELCGVMVGDMNQFLKKRTAWKWDHLESRWMSVGKGGEIDSSRPGMVLLLDAAVGGYHSSIGWVGLDDGGKKPRPVSELRGATTAPDPSMASDPESGSLEWITLDDHLHGVSKEVASLAQALGMDEHAVSDLRLAGRWHDVGKAHDAFQNMLVSGHPDEATVKSGGPWAKSGPPTRRAVCCVYKDGRVINRTHFRHELASALAWLSVSNGAASNPDFVAFLIAAHHGKMRMSIRSAPTEEKPEDDILFARGIWQGDLLPRVRDLLDRELPLDLSLMRMGVGSWTSRMLALRDDSAIGPFRMSLAETLIRVADWRVSSVEAKRS